MRNLSPEILPLGHDGLLVRFATTAFPQATAAVQNLTRRAEAADLPGVCEVVPALASVLFRFDPGVVARATVAAALRTLIGQEDWSAVALPQAARRWLVPAAFGHEHGPALAEAAALAGVSEAEAVRQITGTALRVLAIGFAPGQPYLGFLPENWDLPRQRVLTPQAPAGAILLAVRQLVLFVHASPTGWRQVAQTAFRPFQPDAAQPVLLRGGDELRLVATPGHEVAALMRDGAMLGGARCEVLA
jgi:KipI family sensor histidine kinase inhibitor